MSRASPKGAVMVLTAAVFATGFSGLMAEYSVSTVVGYLTGNTIAAYSILIGVFMASMGVGAFASERLEEGSELRRYLIVETALSVVIAASTICITRAAVYDLTWPAALAIAVVIGTLIGFEIPLLLRFNDQRRVLLKKNVAMVLGADYFGAFVAAVAFVYWFLPVLGTVGTPVAAGAVNLGIAALVLFTFEKPGRHLGFGMSVAGVLIATMGVFGEQIVMSSEQRQYEDLIVYSEQTPYQRIVVTQFKDTHCLYLNGQTQMCTSDERRYHEALIHPAMWINPRARRALVLGGGDGLAVRELLKYEGIRQITLVDLDERILALARELKPLRDANEGSLDDPRVEVVAADGFAWLSESPELFDVVVVDLPDPGHVALAKLYSQEFYETVRNHLAPEAVMVTQSTSPIHAPETFAIIWHTIDESGLAPLPYRVNVPTFGDWGFNVAVREGYLSSAQLQEKLDRFQPPVRTDFLNNAAMVAATRFEKGIFPDDPALLPVSRLVRPAVYEAYQRAWTKVD